MQHAYVVTNDDPGRLQYITWGLVPHWSVDGKNMGRLINARREGIDGKPSFRIPIRKRRCLVPADSFYEWRKEGFKNTAYRIMMQNQGLLFFAGVWDVWYNGDCSVKTFSIITTTSNSEMAGIHNRMPVLLDTAEHRRQWLETSDIREVLCLLQTPPDGILRIYRVSSLVNSVLNDTAELHKEVPEPPTLFV